MSTSAQPTLIVPGINGSGPEHWQDYWIRDRSDCFLVEQEDWVRPRIETWLHKLEADLLEHPDCILVAHSLGCLLVAHLAASPVAALVRGAFLVAPCNLAIAETRHPDMVRFGTMPVKPLPFPSVLAASRNDPYMTPADARTLAERWGASFLDLGEAGHVNVASGFGRWKEGYALASGLYEDFDMRSWHLLPEGSDTEGTTWSEGARETVRRALLEGRHVH